jgi:hypothetical protein
LWRWADIDRLIADAEVVRDVGGPAAGIDEVKHFAPTFGRLAAPSITTHFQLESGARIQ